MGLLRRSLTPPGPTPSDPNQAVREFWQWWHDAGADGTERAIASQGLDAWAQILSARIDALHRDLAWELGPGRVSRHVLVVTAGGDPDLRGVARRWRRAAPEADETWEYSDVRLPTEGLDWGLTLAGRQIDATGVRVGVEVDPQRACVDVVVHHPVFASLPQRARDQATFLLLDGCLGEEAVETWVGTVASSSAVPRMAVTLDRLRDIVRDVTAAHTEDDGSPAWALLEATDRSGAPLLAMAQVPLKPMTAPHLDTHVRIDVPFGDVTPSGMPGDGSLGRLRALEDHVNQLLEDSGRIVAHETSGGVRRLHVYVDGATPAAAQARVAVSGWDQGVPGITEEPDPAWARVRHLRG